MWYLTHGTNFHGEKMKQKAHNSSQKREMRERPSTHLPWSLGILSEESADRPSTGEEETRARITSFEDGQTEVLKEKIKFPQTSK